MIRCRQWLDSARRSFSNLKMLVFGSNDYLSKLTGTSVRERLRHLEENRSVALKR